MSEFPNAANSDQTQDWKTPVVDDDADAPFCTPAKAGSPFACSKIKCIYERKLHTGDVFDFQFKPTTAIPDKMIVRRMHSKIRINKSTTNTAFMPGNIDKNAEFVILTGATALRSAAIALSTLAYMAW